MKQVIFILTIFSVSLHSQKSYPQIDSILNHCDELKRQDISALSVHVDSAFRISQRNNYLKGIFRALYIMVEVKCSEGRFKEADSLLNIYQSYLNSSVDQKSKADFFLCRANKHNFEDNVSSALNDFDNAYKLYLELNDSANIKSILISFTILYNKQGLFTKALEYSQKSLTLAQRSKDTFEILSCYANMSESYDGLSDTINRTNMFRNMLSIVTSFKHDMMRNIVYSNYASIMIDEMKYDSALYYLHLSTPFFDNNSLNLYSIINRIHIGRLNYRVGDIKEAELVITKALDLKKKHNEILPIELEIYINEILYELNRDNKNYKSAIEYLENSISLKDSLMNEKTQWMTSMTEEKIKSYDFENKRLKDEKKISNQNTTILALLSFILLAALSFIYYSRLQKKTHLLNSEKIKSLEKEKEFIKVESSLKGQLNERIRISQEIHDELGSSLTSISLLTEILKKKVDTLINPEVDKISNTSSEMVDKMNEIIWSLNSKNDTLRSLIAYSIKFVRGLLQDANIKLHYEEPKVLTDRILDSQARRNIYLCIKEAINNVVKHSGASSVDLSIEVNDLVKIIIKDNGNGFDKMNLPQFRNGIVNMEKRMEEINGCFEIYSMKNQGTEVLISYNLQS